MGNKIIKLFFYGFILSLNSADHLFPVVWGEPHVPLLFTDRVLRSYNLFRSKGEGLVILLSFINVSLVDKVGGSIPLKHLQFTWFCDWFISHTAYNINEF